MNYPINLSASHLTHLTHLTYLTYIKNSIVNNEIELQKNLQLDATTLDLSNPETLKLYNANQELQALNKHVDFLIYKLVCLFNFLLSKKCDMQLLIK